LRGPPRRLRAAGAAEAIFPAPTAVRVKIGKIGKPGNRFSALSTVSGRLTDWQGVALSSE